MKYLPLLAAAMICLFTACDNTQKGNSSSGESNGGTSAAQKNSEAMSVVIEAFRTGDTSGIDNVVAADLVLHDEGGDIGRDSLKASIVQFHKALPDMKIELLKEVADSEYVFHMFHYTGTGDGVLMPPGPYDMIAVGVNRMKNGKCVEHWGFVNGAELSKMMSKMPPPAQAPAAGHGG